MTMSKASVSSTLQCWGTVSSPRHRVTSTPPKEWMVRPSPTLMATVLVFLKVFSPTPFIFHHLQKGYHVLLLQELNEEPSLPHIYSHGGQKCKIFTNINKREKKNGTAIVVSSALRPYTKFVPNSDNDGLMCSVEITLPGGPPTLLTSLYSPL